MSFPMPGDELGPCPCGHRRAMCHRVNASMWCGGEGDPYAAPLLVERDELRAAVVDALSLLDFHRGQTLTKADELTIEAVRERLTVAARLCDVCGSLDTKAYPAFPGIEDVDGFFDYLCDEHSDLARPEDAN